LEQRIIRGRKAKGIHCINSDQETSFLIKDNQD